MIRIADVKPKHVSSWYLDQTFVIGCGHLGITCFHVLHVLGKVVKRKRKRSITVPGRIVASCFVHTKYLHRTANTKSATTCIHVLVVPGETKTEKKSLRCCTSHLRCRNSPIAVQSHVGCKKKKGSIILLVLLSRCTLQDCNSAVDLRKRS